MGIRKVINKRHIIYCALYVYNIFQIRFLKTANFYGAFRPKIRIPFFPQTKVMESKSVRPKDILWSSQEGKRGLLQDDFIWGPLDDVVMGGVSKTDLTPGQPFDGKWSGFTSSANNGGFAGIRTKIFESPLNLSACKGLKIKLKADGQRYKFILRDDDDWNGTAWSNSFDTEKGNKLIEVSIPFDKFIPTRFARKLPLIVPFRKNNIRALQFTLSKFEYEGNLNPKFTEGPFSVEIQSIEAF